MSNHSRYYLKLDPSVRYGSPEARTASASERYNRELAVSLCDRKLGKDATVVYSEDVNAIEATVAAVAPEDAA